ncbi:MAG: transcription termination/antitermination protein NusA [Bacilli bacterium]|nr:transcription termination/antitermination protein NusA [Bacilli bacterium]
MNSEEFLKAVKVLEDEKGIKEDTIYEAMELALTSSYKKNSGLQNARVKADRDTGEFHLYSFKTVVLDKEHEKSLDEDEITITDEELEEMSPSERLEKLKPFTFDERLHITLEDAKKIDKSLELGDTIETEITPKDFGRVAASTAKQVVIQKIREAERSIIEDEYADKEGEMVSGTVEMEDERNYYIDLGRTQGILSKDEIIPGETIEMGSHIKVYISKVDNNGKGPLILLSRKHYGFVKRLFELEIPEINDGTILIYSVAREAGNRTKVAVYSENERVDAVGSCIGERGSRINNIIDELNGEKIDVIPYDKDVAKFIENALSPAKNLHVIINDPKEETALVIVDDDNLSLAIGKKGLNVRLAARLTHYKLDVKTTEQVRELGINFVEENNED